MKKICLVLLLCLTYSKAYALIVHDPESCAKAIEQLQQTASHYRQEIVHWQDQINHFKEQTNILKSQLASLSGLRDIRNLDEELVSLIHELRGIDRHREELNELLRSPDSELSTYANKILSKYSMFNNCKKKGNAKLDNICKEVILNKACTIEAGEQIKKQIERKIIETSKIANRAKNSKDLKESQDLANVIAIKNIEINQLKNHWDSLVNESNLREKLIEEKRKAAFYEHQRNAPLPNIQFK